MSEKDTIVTVPEQCKDKVFLAVGEVQRAGVGTENEVADIHSIIALCQGRGLEDAEKVRMALRELVSERKILEESRRVWSDSVV